MVQSSGNLETILVVDDTPAVLTLVVQILEEANFNVLEARSGAEAISVAQVRRQNPPAAI